MITGVRGRNNLVCWGCGVGVAGPVLYEESRLDEPHRSALIGNHAEGLEVGLACVAQLSRCREQLEGSLHAASGLCAVYARDRKGCDDQPGDRIGEAGAILFVRRWGVRANPA